jgi:hypothetical protein
MSSQPERLGYRTSKNRFSVESLLSFFFTSIHVSGQKRGHEDGLDCVLLQISQQAFMDFRQVVFFQSTNNLGALGKVVKIHDTNVVQLTHMALGSRDIGVRFSMVTQHWGGKCSFDPCCCLILPLTMSGAARGAISLCL